MTSVGTSLKEARKKQGILIEDAAKFTKIQPRLLEALENEEFYKLPDQVYTKAFLKKYAEYLGLDAKEIVQQLKNAKVLESQEIVYSPSQEESLKRLPLPRPCTQERGLQTQFLSRKKFVRVFAVIILFMAFVFFLRFTHRPKDVVKPRLEVSTAAEKPPTQEIIKESEKTTTLPSKSLKLSVKAKGDCKVSVTADGKLLFEDFMLKGASQTWQAKEEFRLDTNDGSAIEVILNGKGLGRFKKGPKTDIVITKDGVAKQ